MKRNIFPNRFTKYWKTCNPADRKHAINLAEKYLCKAEDLINEARDICIGQYNNMSDFDYAIEKIKKCFHWIDEVREQIKKEGK